MSKHRINKFTDVPLLLLHIHIYYFTTNIKVKLFI